MKLVKKASSAIDHTMDFLSFLGIMSIVFVLLAVISAILFRYFMRTSLEGVTELSEYSLLFMTFVGAAWVLRVGGHVKMDILLDRLKPDTRTLANTIIFIVCAVLWLVIAWYGLKVTWLHYETDYFIRAGIDTPSFITLAIIPLGSLMLSIQLLKMAGQYWGGYRSAKK